MPASGNLTITPSLDCSCLLRASLHFKVWLKAATGQTGKDRPVTGVLAEWMALNLSLAMFSPQPSKMHTRTGFLFLEILSCGFRALSMAMAEGSAHQRFSWCPRAINQ